MNVQVSLVRYFFVPLFGFVAFRPCATTHAARIQCQGHRRVVSLHLVAALRVAESQIAFCLTQNIGSTDNVQQLNCRELPRQCRHCRRLARSHCQLSATRTLTLTAGPTAASRRDPSAKSVTFYATRLRTPTPVIPLVLTTARRQCAHTVNSRRVRFICESDEPAVGSRTRQKIELSIALLKTNVTVCRECRNSGIWPTFVGRVDELRAALDVQRITVDKLWNKVSTFSCVYYTCIIYISDFILTQKI